MSRELSFKQQFRLLVVLLGLCPECEAEYRLFFEQQGRTPAQIVRDVFWNWRADWAHGYGCPANLADAEPVEMSSPSDAGAAPVGVGAEVS